MPINLKKKDLEELNIKKDINISKELNSKLQSITLGRSYLIIIPVIYNLLLRVYYC
jgi:hypothetical protein